MSDLATNTSVSADAVISSSSGKHRLQFEFSTEAYSRLQDMKEEAGASSYAALVRDALRVYEYFQDQKRRGYDVALHKDGEPLKVVEFLTKK